MASSEATTARTTAFTRMKSLVHRTVQQNVYSKFMLRRILHPKRDPLVEVMEAELLKQSLLKEEVVRVLPVHRPLKKGALLQRTADFCEVFNHAANILVAYSSDTGFIRYYLMEKTCAGGVKDALHENVSDTGGTYLRVLAEHPLGSPENVNNVIAKKLQEVVVNVDGILTPVFQEATVATTRVTVGECMDACGPHYSVAWHNCTHGAEIIRNKLDPNGPKIFTEHREIVADFVATTAEIAYDLGATNLAFVLGSFLFIDMLSQKYFNKQKHDSVIRKTYK